MLEKITSPFRQFGPFAGFIYLINRFFCRVSSHLRLFYYDLMVQPVSDRPLIPAARIKQLEIRALTRGDPEFDLMPVPPEILELRFRQNAICLGAFKRERLIGYIWFCFGAYDEDEVRCRFVLEPEQESVFDFDLYLFPEHRFGLGFIGIWEGANRFLRSRGIRYSFSRLTRFNLASKRAHDHLGWKRVGRALFMRAWRLEFMLASLFPYVYLSLRESGRPQLILRPGPLEQELASSRQ